MPTPRKLATKAAKADDAADEPEMPQQFRVIRSLCIRRDNGTFHRRGEFTTMEALQRWPYRRPSRPARLRCVVPVSPE